MSNGTTAAIVGADAQFSGRFSGQDLDVLGQLEGEVEVKGRLRIGKQGRVKARVKAAVTEIEGEFEGELRSDALTLTETAKARGTFVAKRLNVREGALLEGSINPGATAVPTAPTPAPGPAHAGAGGSAQTPAGGTEAPPATSPEGGGKTP
jgi:cytoskeletal protein CcmA (bactofilin family)